MSRLITISLTLSGLSLAVSATSCVMSYHAYKEHRAEVSEQRAQLYEKFKTTSHQLICGLGENSKTYLLSTKDVPDFPTFRDKIDNHDCFVLSQ